MLAVGLMEVIRNPQVQKQEGVAWLDKGCFLQKKKSHSRNPRCHFAWQARRWNKELRELLPTQPSLLKKESLRLRTYSRSQRLTVR